MISRHKGKEVCGGFELGFFMLGLPVNKEGVGHSGEHALDPHGIGVSDTGQVIKVRDIESLMQAAFDAPVLAVK